MMSNGYFVYIYKYIVVWINEEVWYVDLEGDVWYLDIIILYNLKIYIYYWWFRIVCLNIIIMLFIEYWMF